MSTSRARLRILAKRATVYLTKAFVMHEVSLLGNSPLQVILLSTFIAELAYILERLDNYIIGTNVHMHILSSMCFSN